MLTEMLIDLSTAILTALRIGHADHDVDRFVDSHMDSVENRTKKLKMLDKPYLDFKTQLPDCA